MSQNPNSHNQEEDPITPRRLELSISPEDGSLMTAPLSTVVLAATNGLYSDLYNMAHGELEVAQPQQTQQQNDDSDDDSPLLGTKRKERMSNLSFAQRRHELAYRIAQHGKSIEKVAALTAAAFSSNLGESTKIATRALQHARTAWVQADEAQDALYFFHARLFPARQAPHDVLGALDVVMSGQWKDLPDDLQLKVDRYDTSPEQQWTAKELTDRWHMSVRDKLIRGEVGRLQRQHLSDGTPKPLWRTTLRGGVLRMTHGMPRKGTSPPVYPLEAHLSVFSTLPNAEWTLLSIEVRAEAKTGESNHQLDTNHQQRYNLHRLCAQAMTREEARAREEVSSVLARPLDCLFQVAYTFALSWQLEVLSAQAEALRKGVWSGGQSSAGLSVTPVQFFENGDSCKIGELSIHFWRVDDRYGPPSMGDLYIGKGPPGNGPLEIFNDSTEKTEDDMASVTTSSSVNKARAVSRSAKSGQFTLSIRADTRIGIQVSLSGGDSIMEGLPNNDTTRKTVEELLDAASNPFSLSISDAILASTRLCAERKCQAIWQALQKDDNVARLLPPWMDLSVNRGNISVAARISLHHGKEGTNSHSRPFVVLFRLSCDARTGAFVATFSRSATLLRLLGGNHFNASEVVSIRTARLAQNKRKVASHGTGRVVREAFDGLTRSMHALGQRTGVGGSWDDLDNKSPSLRQRAIQLACEDVRKSLMTCCGMAAVYGLSSLALGVATGVAAAVDVAGGSLDTIDDVSFIPTPPLAVIMDQQLIQRENRVNGEMKKHTLLERELFAVSCSITEDAVTLYGMDIVVQMESPSSFEHTRVNCELKALKSPELKSGWMNGESNGGGPRKRAKIETNGTVEAKATGIGEDSSQSHQMLLDEVQIIASVFSKTLESE